MVKYNKIKGKVVELWVLVILCLAVVLYMWYTFNCIFRKQSYLK